MLTVALGLPATTTSEFRWKGVSDSPLSGVTHNPWRHGFNAGASSAGAGAACAAGCGPLHHGSDGAGSIRAPIVPNSNSDNVVHQETLTRTVADVALMLRSMAGPHPENYLSLEAPPADYTAARGGDLLGFRIAFSPDLGHAHVDPAVGALVREAVEGLPDLGAAVEEVKPDWEPQGAELRRFFWPSQYAQYSRLLRRWRDAHGAGACCLHRSQQRRCPSPVCRSCGSVNSLTADDGSRLHVERCKQRGGSVSRVVVGAPLGLAGLHRQQRLGSIERLNLALFIDAEHHGAFGRERYRPTMSRTFSTNSGSDESLKVPNDAAASRTPAKSDGSWTAHGPPPSPWPAGSNA
jgi:hypothetical protein